MSKEVKCLIALLGGLGNQLHQIALGLFLEQQGYRISFDISAKNLNPTIRKINSELFDFVETHIEKSSRFMPGSLGRFKGLSRVIWKMRHPFYDLVIDETAYGPDVIQSSRNIHLIGYFQRYEYAHILKKKYTRNTGISDKLHPRIAIHIRLGDYAGLPSELPFSYYRNLILIFRANPRFSKLPIHIISNDPKSCMKELSDFEFLQYANGIDEYDDFEFLKHSEIVAISKSSFSWWSGFLSDSEVYYPHPWDIEMREESELLLHKNLMWKQIEYQETTVNLTSSGEQK